jgi:hypothetical protein
MWTLSLNSLSIGSMSSALLRDGERDSPLGYARYIYHSIIFGEALFYLNLRMRAQVGSTHLPNTISLVKLSEVMIPKLYTIILKGTTYSFKSGFKFVLKFTSVLIFH